jgi:putative membrane protein
MRIAANIAVAVVAFLHMYFLVLEMFLWNKPFGLKTFKLTQAFADESKGLAANQGLYNGFLAAGLIWSLIANETIAPQLKVFFLVCVIVAGIYGGITASRAILAVQMTPGIIALALVVLSQMGNNN